MQRKRYSMPNMRVSERAPIQRARATFSHQLKNLKGYQIEETLVGEDGWNPVKNGNALVKVVR